MEQSKYFSHDSNARNDDKVVNMRMQMGLTGYAIYFMILERLRESKDFMGVKDYNIIAFDLRADAKDVKRVIEDFGLFQFTEDGKLFYSESFLNRMNAMEDYKEKKKKAGEISAAKRWHARVGENVAEQPVICNTPITHLSENGNTPITHLPNSIEEKETEKKEPKKRIKEKEEENKNKNKKEAYSKEYVSGSPENSGSPDASSSSVPPIEKENFIVSNDEIDFDEIVEFWNATTCCVFGKLICIDKSRAKMTRARIIDHGKDSFFQAIRNAAESVFLRSVTWFSYDWMIRPNNFIKVLEGRYSNRETQNNSGCVTENGKEKNVKPVRQRVYD